MPLQLSDRIEVAPITCLLESMAEQVLPIAAFRVVGHGRTALQHHVHINVALITCSLQSTG